MAAPAAQDYVILDEGAVAALAGSHLGTVTGDVADIGDGNLNVVFRVQADAGSVVVKQALPYLRVAGEAWPLTRHRARIEWRALQVHSQFCPGLFPELLEFDDARSAIVMEDLRSFISWRDLLVRGVSTPGVAAKVGAYAATVLLSTGELVLSGAARERLQMDFVYSEMCGVTEQLVFDTPYQTSPLNRIDPELAEAAASLVGDQRLDDAVAALKRRFRTESHSLLHGDLHTGSVMVNGDQTRIIDLEFAFFGPPGFDVGSLLANLAIARTAHRIAGLSNFAAEIDRYASEFWQTFAATTRRLWPAPSSAVEPFLDNLLADSAQFAGLEMIRRIVGLAHAKDIDSLPPPVRLRAQTAVLAAGRDLVAGPRVRDLADAWSRATAEESSS